MCGYVNNLMILKISFLSFSKKREPVNSKKCTCTENHSYFSTININFNGEYSQWPWFWKNTINNGYTRK